MKFAKVLRIQMGATLSFVGAGGKTSLMFAVAGELTSKGCRVLVTTTTAMFYPKRLELGYSKVVLGNDVFDKRISSRRKSVIVAASRYDRKNNKLIGYTPTAIDMIGEMEWFDFILVEADGARMKSIKAPAFHEPAIPETTNTVVGCVGLDSIGKFLNTYNVHRPEFLLSLTDDPTSNVINEENIFTLASSDKGLFKDAGVEMTKIVFLNKADNTDLVSKGRKLAREIKKKCPHVERTIVACLKDAECPVKVVL